MGAAAALVATSLPARADSAPPAAPPDATVVAIDAGDLVIDIGATKGVHDGEILELWRPVKLRHPVTGQILVDRFRIGSVRLTPARAPALP
jgi:hypothetical protein